mmetsp:Transcript_20722/g.45096  ORF Transcript_20722/g.45096 Transcript_20722/m.45096 type:complete len:410 (-) Transcript_20722:113-1342(-)|eukprot:CAMPEP_0180418192 /NCGR_PEP_ID=MMETSP1036_2-20121128/1435_1 /TAXON_ID=632150 /ORGANISM="Azadinium spinosum, Strain 3D9" /LENGTH=409 /DNA_ID=CAMNT_0022423271 /DNA_START=66 /DNA_END=1295 /DNA_ORIENTATION=-
MSSLPAGVVLLLSLSLLPTCTLADDSQYCGYGKERLMKFVACGFKPGANVTKCDEEFAVKCCPRVEESGKNHLLRKSSLHAGKIIGNKALYEAPEIMFNVMFPATMATRTLFGAVVKEVLMAGLKDIVRKTLRDTGVKAQIEDWSFKQLCEKGPDLLGEKWSPHMQHMCTERNQTEALLDLLASNFEKTLFDVCMCRHGCPAEAQTCNGGRVFNTPKMFTFGNCGRSYPPVMWNPHENECVWENIWGFWKGAFARSDCDWPVQNVAGGCACNPGFKFVGPAILFAGESTSDYSDYMHFNTSDVRSYGSVLSACERCTLQEKQMKTIRANGTIDIDMLAVEVEGFWAVDAHLNVDDLPPHAAWLSAALLFAGVVIGAATLLAVLHRARYGSRSVLPDQAAALYEEGGSLE